MKSRGVTETPGGTILLAAHRAMESITLDRGRRAPSRTSSCRVMRSSSTNGFWFSPEREMASGDDRPKSQSMSRAKCA